MIQWLAMKDAEYHNKISQMHWRELQGLWQQILACETPDWESGRAFEYLVVRMFELDGFKAKYPFSVKLPHNAKVMEQIDGVVYHDALGVLFESKDYSNIQDKTKRNVNIEAVAKLRNQLQRRPYLTMGCVFSSGDFTEPVSTLIDYLGNETILLWRGEEVNLCLQKRKVKPYFLTKLESRIEYGIHDFDITTLE